MLKNSLLKKKERRKLHAMILFNLGYILIAESVILLLVHVLVEN